jgi:3',5'-cyclic AMP phosphodiesterase CpdA
MAHISWLHLTDLHCGMQDQPWLWPGVRVIFFEDLRKLYDKCGPWDLILFTGDLTYSGAASQFQQVNDLFEQLWEAFDKLHFKPQLLAVPGNHDLVWQDKKRMEIKINRKT